MVLRRLVQMSYDVSGVAECSGDGLGTDLDALDVWGFVHRKRLLGGLQESAKVVPAKTEAGTVCQWNGS